MFNNLTTGQFQESKVSIVSASGVTKSDEFSKKVKLFKEIVANSESIDITYNIACDLLVNVILTEAKAKNINKDLVENIQNMVNTYVLFYMKTKDRQILDMMAVVLTDFLNNVTEKKDQPNASSFIKHVYLKVVELLV